MEIDSKKIKEVFKTLPRKYAETVAKEHGVSQSMVRYAKEQAESQGEEKSRKLRENTLDIIESLVKLAKENAKSDSNQISRINKLL